MDDMRDELTDRFGPIPKSVDNLLTVAYLRTVAQKVFVTDISQKRDAIEFRVKADAAYEPKEIAPFIAGYKGKVKLIAGAKPYFIYRFSGSELNGRVNPLEVSLRLCEAMKTLVVEKV